MRQPTRLFLAAVFAVAATIVPATAGENRSDGDAIQALIAKYAAGVNAEPVDIKLLSEVWDNSSDVSLINTEAYEQGWEQIKRNFYEGTMEALFTDRRLTIHEVKVHASGDSGWAEFRWHFTAKMKQGGSAIQTNGIETQVYRKVSGDRWVLVHVHYSALSR